MKYPLILILLCNFHISEITCSINETVCANSFDSNNRKHEIIKCILPEYDVELNLECKVQLNYDVSEFEIYDVIKVALRLLYKSSTLTNVINETLFKWDAVGEHKSDKSISHHSNFDLNTKLENNITVYMTFVNRTMESLANLVLYNIYEEKMYRICPFFELLKDNSVCCEVEIKKEEETLLEMNFYMCLVLVGLLVLVFIVIAMVSCICPSDHYKSVDEMLTKMPNEQVKALKQMVRNERNSMVQEEMIKGQYYKNSKEGGNTKGFDNFGAVFDGDDTYGMNDNDNLYVEIGKERNLNRQSMQSQRKKSASGDIDDLAAKIVKEEKRRASIGPYMKPYALQNIYDSD